MRTITYVLPDLSEKDYAIKSEEGSSFALLVDYCLFSESTTDRCMFSKIKLNSQNG